MTEQAITRTAIFAFILAAVALVGALVLLVLGKDVPGALWVLTGAGGSAGVALPVAPKA